ncbi:hypothetical protein CRE_13641 [Caenorhabditis remanei]|uniref:Uncharacterized protein n=1 Tax=Caenorhabditis remanei TaxID=31234 RepID=E3N1F4_CAERE|nr:hypothetical protein CRE_13641 [Caenorhabditis remanei]
MPVIPVQYESLKAILPHMEPNTRFQISLRMPSISSLESRIPLKIENLTLTKLETKVNESSYRLSSISVRNLKIELPKFSFFNCYCI